MDEIVLRALARWPNVPAVYGWLRLDRRGNWLVRIPAPAGGGARFGRITHPAVIAFIGRNYERDARGRWFFQNGPQRVFVALDYTPFVYRLDEEARGLVAHTGAAPHELRALYADEAGALLVEADLGVGVVDDRDLAALLDRLSAQDGVETEALLQSIAQGERACCRLFGRSVALEPIRSADVAARFGFVPEPRPAPGEPECADM